MEEKYLFLSYIREKIKEHPEWLTDTIVTIQGGLQERIREEQDRSMTFDTAMTVLLMSKAGEKVAEQQKPIIEKAWKVSSYNNE